MCRASMHKSEAEIQRNVFLVTTWMTVMNQVLTALDARPPRVHREVLIQQSMSAFRYLFDVTNEDVVDTVLFERLAELRANASVFLA